ncbi:MAG: hypothetical protein JWP97_6789 [Labilithrix sp.]|nr:hypothetical protein [Labilithrix sp.]
MPNASFLTGLLLTVTLATACGGSTSAGGTKWAARKEGCDVAISNDAPGVPSDNIGTVNATCASDVSDEDCLRTLKDQVCRLGGDLAWGVEPAPRMINGKKQFSGRAAHSRAPGK